MAAVRFLLRQGLVVQAGENDQLIVRPASKLTNETRQYIREHKPQIISELMKMERVTWLALVAKELGCEPLQLIEGGFIDQHDLDEQHQADPREVVRLVRSNPRWPPADRKSEAPGNPPRLRWPLL